MYLDAFYILLLLNLLYVFITVQIPRSIEKGCKITMCQKQRLHVPIESTKMLHHEQAPAPFGANPSN